MHTVDNDKLSKAASQLMAIEVVSELLVSSSPRKLCEKLSDHLRELTGAKTVMILVHRAQPELDELLHVSPSRRGNLFSETELNVFCHEISPEELPYSLVEFQPDHPLKNILDLAGIKSMARYFLHAGGDIIGQLLLFDLPGVERISEINQILHLLAPPISLALKNALAFYQIEQQSLELEHRVEERTAELKNKTHEILKSEERLRTIIQTCMEGFWLLDAEYHILEVNNAYCQMSGYKKEELLGIHIKDLEVLDSAEVIAVRGQKIQEQGGDRFESLHRRNDGSIFHVEVSVKFLPLGGGQYAVFIHDITDRKRADEEKRNFEQQIQHTQRLESLGVLSGGIAHDFNNILAIIMGYCSLTKLNFESAEKNITEIEKAAERGAALCRQMLAYAGKAQLSKAQVNMGMMVDEVVSMLNATLSHNAVIRLGLPADISYIDADASQLRQVVMNLIINASEAIGTQQGEIAVSLRNTEIIDGQADKDYQGKTIPAGNYICLEVTDNGCGMDEETKWRIFEPFYTTKFSGRGLGMSAVLGIINSHGGALQLFSQLGHGTTFKVYLPVPTYGTPDEEGGKLTVPEMPWHGNGTILLVEDEEQIRFLAMSMLEILGFTVLQAKNGKEALELYHKKNEDITLVLTDMGMPVMDGYALYSALKNINPQLPIIISSGFGDTDVAARLGHDILVDMISKPYNTNQLREVVKSALEKASTHT